MILKTLFGERDIHLLSVVVVLLGICETVYGISRYKSDVFWACGHFDNPAGFASMLIALLPFVVYQVVRRGFLLRILGICAIGIFFDRTRIVEVTSRTSRCRSDRCDLFAAIYL